MTPTGSIMVGVGRGLWKVYLVIPFVTVITSLRPQNAQIQGKQVMHVPEAK